MLHATTHITQDARSTTYKTVTFVCNSQKNKDGSSPRKQQPTAHPNPYLMGFSFKGVGPATRGGERCC
eukprot:3246155-Amphidinium_carterae.1